MLERASGDEDGLGKTAAGDMLLVLNSATRLIDTIQRLLDDSRVPSHVEIYQSVRMAEVLEKWELAQ